MPPIKVLVLDMQVITPAVGGGRLRLLGLYHSLGCDLPTTYLGTYDWPGERSRDVQLTPTLREVLVPLSAATFAAHEELSRTVGGRVVIDTAFHRVVPHSTDFLKRLLQELPEADVIICSHPWIYPLIAGSVDKTRQLLVYDAHNVEGFLRLQLLDDGGHGREIAEDVARVELALCKDADLVLCCSHEDLMLFHSAYRLPLCKLRIAPNGVFTDQIRPTGREAKLLIRSRLGVVHPSVAIFIGSEYGPNAEAARFLIDKVAPGLPSTLFVIAGGVGRILMSSRTLPFHPASNVFVTGRLTDEEKLDWLQCSDLAVNPMFSGSGTNIKMFDFLSAGLPVVSTDTGARGIPWRDEGCIRVVTASEFGDAVRETLTLPHMVAGLGRNARALAERSFSWERISPWTGIVLREEFRRLRASTPDLSIVLPPHAGDDACAAILDSLAAQTRKDFEVIIVGGGNSPNSCCSRNDLVVARGTTPARDTASLLELALALAKGSRIVFLSRSEPLEPRFVETLLSADSPEALKVLRTDDLRLCVKPFAQRSSMGDPIEERPLTVSLSSLLGLPVQRFRARIEPLSAYLWRDAGNQPELPICESRIESICRWLESCGGGPWQLGALGPIERSDQVSTIVVMEDLLASDDFVSEVYRRILGREPDPSGLSHYQRVLADGSVTRQDVITRVLESAEGRSRRVRVVTHAESSEHLRHFGELYLPVCQQTPRLLD